MRIRAGSFVGMFLATAVAVLATDPDLPLKPGLDAITPDALLAHIKVLSSDEFEGRAPGTKGEELSVSYITDQLRKIGLLPGNPNGNFTQEVPLAGIKSDPKMSFMVNGQAAELKYPDDYVASSARLQPEIKIDNSDIVFVGYGIVAPEYGWDDYKDVDVHGKTILMLINDPPIPSPKDPSKLDEKMFKGKAMTYYGRWTYKYEIAALKGAAAAVIIHETEPAAYPYTVVKTSWAKENFELDTPDKNAGAVQVRSWITLDVAKKLLADCGQNFDALKKAAISKNFRPVTLNAKANIEIKQTLRSFKSNNVIAKLEGSDPNLKNEYVIYTAHWDHLGRHPELSGDQIFNGAVDNASGDAAVILNVWGKARDVEDTSFGLSTLDDMLADAAKRQGRTAISNSRPEKGSFYRADNFEFSKAGLPSLYIGKGEHLLSRAPDAPLRSDEFDLKDYHQVTDEVKPDWDLSGAAQDVQLLFEVGHEVANGDKWPEWKAGAEFKTKRDAMLRK